MITNTPEFLKLMARILYLIAQDLASHNLHHSADDLNDASDNIYAAIANLDHPHDGN